MPEFRSENRIRWLKGLSRIGPVIVIVAITFGLGSLRISEDVLFWALAIVLGVAVTGYFLIRAMLERRALHIKIGSDWIRIRRGTKVLSAPLHYVTIEQSVLFDGRFKVSHPRKKLSFTISLDRFPAEQRLGLRALLAAHAQPSTGMLANFMGTDPPNAQ
jgi:hypothetical protein